MSLKGKTDPGMSIFLVQDLNSELKLFLDPRQLSYQVDTDCKNNAIICRLHLSAALQNVTLLI